MKCGESHSTQECAKNQRHPCQVCKLRRATPGQLHGVPHVVPQDKDKTDATTTNTSLPTNQVKRPLPPHYCLLRLLRSTNSHGVDNSCIDHYPLQHLQTQNTEAVAIATQSFFNAKSPTWHSRITTARGRALLNYTDAHNDLTILGPTEPTYYAPNHLPDVLDVAILKSIRLIAQISAQYEGSTVHNPVLLDVGRRQRDVGTFTRRFTDWGRFRAEMQKNTAIPVIETTDELEAAIPTLETDIKHALTQTTTETEVPRLTNPRRILPDDIKQLIRDRRRLKRLATRTRLPQHRHDLNVR
ncbi:hypothetical protein NQ315_012470 [Exocentrus adspersus]|uniref:Uncharacterized protein n=1 Tax=Exocentrus adspersus TaxID=1586481 RepID=A0AAV8VNC7_9CUCU|nr:hypothetical protein NQ315_012470 [Exocentrus adspersus]